MPTTTSYKLGRDCIADVPGVANDDIVDATINVTGNDLDVTCFKATAVSELVHMVGLVEITIDVNCTHVSGVIGDEGSFDIAGLPNTDFNLTILDIKEKPNLRGKVDYTVSYGFTEAAA